MPKNNKYEKAIAKLNQVISDSEMHIDAVDGVDIATIVEGEEETEKDYYEVKATILIPVDSVTVHGDDSNSDSEN